MQRYEELEHALALAESTMEDDDDIGQLEQLVEELRTELREKVGPRTSLTPAGYVWSYLACTMWDLDLSWQP
jgi:hypothetical protein